MKLPDEEMSDTCPQPGRSPLTLRIAVVGAGIGGLAAAYLLGLAGHKITVFEAAPFLAEVGAGMQLSPNATRLLLRWGHGERLKEVAVVPQALTFRRYQNGEVVGWRKWGDNMQKEYDAPYYHIHRADLHRMLLDRAKPYTTIRLKSTVVDVNPSLPSLTLASGEVVNVDLILGADGLHSRVRDIMIGAHDSPTPTRDASYRALIKTSLMMKDPELKTLIDEGVNCWMGPKRHIVGYCIRRKELYNLVMVHPCRDPNEETARLADPKIVRKEFEGFEPRIQKLLSLITFSMEWPLMDRQPLERWVHQEGKVCLLGDSCHPMLPYRAQGASMALEDAAVLGNLLAGVFRKEEIAPLLHAYQELRHDRTANVQKESRLNQLTFHFEDGPNQVRRDKSMRVAMEAALKEARGEYGDDCRGSQNFWADKEINDRIFSYDADAEVDIWWKKCKNQGVGPPRSKL